MPRELDVHADLISLILSLILISLILSLILSLIILILLYSFSEVFYKKKTLTSKKVRSRVWWLYNT